MNIKNWHVLLPLWLLFLTAAGCSKKDVSPSVKARVLRTSCGGTVLQFIDTIPARGKAWRWFKNLNGPFDANNPAQIYQRCVTASGVSVERQVTGDTLDFIYEQITNPPGLVCTIGGLPNAYILIKHVN